MTYLAHQLKGSGGSYGFQRISTDAAELEKAVEVVMQLLEKNPPPKRTRPPYPNYHRQTMTAVASH